MHKCVNNTIGNVYHLEQLVDNFFPYSQQKLGFDKPVTIIFQSDEDNATKMLGKTAYYDPSALEVVLYTDNRHPKDVMRSLSHELVHHAQNCRGDFTSEDSTFDGYAQKDPHLRKMEREAYTKGNLIFRDFEDLIKTGKINIEIDFSESGEPKMSLKEWKNNELNMLLMKKWGLLKEDKGSECKEGFEWQDGECVELQQESEEEKLNEKTEGGELEEGCPPDEEGGEAIDISAPGMEVHVDDVTQLSPEEAFAAGMAAARDAIDQVMGGPDIEEGMKYRDEDEAEAIKQADERRAGMEAGEKAAEEKKAAEEMEEGVFGSKNVFTMGENSRKISVKEAKEITRRIIARIKEESS